MPKGGASSLTPVYAGLREDLDSFLRAYLRFESIRFADYKQMFQHRGMVQLFNGRSNSAEIIEFNECLLVHCLPYMEEYSCSGTPRSLKERLFGLYSLYSFFYLQQEKHVVKVRMDPDSSRNFRKLAEYLLREQIYDSYMICLKLLEDKAINHVAFISIHDPSNFKRFYTDGKVSGVSFRTNLNDPLINVKNFVESDTFQKLVLVHREYAKLKKTTGFTGCQLENPEKSVNGIIENSAHVVERFLGVDEIINTDHSNEQRASRGMLRLFIKDHAHAADLKLPRSRRHRSSDPIAMSTDTFDYAQDLSCKTADIKRLKLLPEVKPTKSAFRKKNEEIKKRGRKKRWLKPEKIDRSIDEERLLKTRMPNFSSNNYTNFKLDLGGSSTPVTVDSPNLSICAEKSSHSKETAATKVSIKPNSNKNKKKEKKQHNIKRHIKKCETPYEKLEDKYRLPDRQLSLDNAEVLLETDAALKTVSCIHSLKSIIKVKNAPSRHVSFRENKNGDLENTIHEIPREFDNGSVEKDESEISMLSIINGEATMEPKIVQDCSAGRPMEDDKESVLDCEDMCMVDVSDDVMFISESESEMQVDDDF